MKLGNVLSIHVKETGEGSLNPQEEGKEERSSQEALKWNNLIWEKPGKRKVNKCGVMGRSRI